MESFETLCLRTHHRQVKRHYVKFVIYKENVKKSSRTFGQITGTSITGNVEMKRNNPQPQS